MEQLDEKAINIYTDGSTYGGPRRGGVDYLFVTVDEAGNPLVHEESPPGFYRSVQHRGWCGIDREVGGWARGAGRD